MTIEVLARETRGRSPALPLALRLALRDLRGGLGGFYVFLACVALGVAVIAGVGALSDALRAGFDRQGQALLGGDISLSRIHVRGSAQERAWLGGQGRVSEIATMRSMARRTDTQAQVLAELKAVDAVYPLYGEVELAGGEGLPALATGRVGLAEPILLERLGLKLGDSVLVGTANIRIAGLIKREPDQLAERMPFGPRLLVSTATL
jgi:putative ABC transport system permease protein